MDAEGALSQFLEESYTNIENFELGLLNLEKNYDKEEYIKSLFRCMHTIKGSAGFFNFKNLENIAHRTEDIFTYLLKLESEKRIELIKKNYLSNLFFRINDETRKLLNSIKDRKIDHSQSIDNLVNDLNNFNLEIFSNKELAVTLKSPSKKLSALQLKALEDLKKTMANESMKSKLNIGAYDTTLDDNIIIKKASLEQLSSITTELIVARNQLELILNSEYAHSNKLFANFHKIDQLIDSLTQRLTKIRLQPISKISDNLKRIVSDAALSCGKQVNFEIHGENIEIDREILEIIHDPLIHLLRNAIDHGIESPEHRLKNAKDVVGNIIIRVAYGDNCVKLSLTDDGKGIDLRKVINKALENNLITKEQLKTIVRKDLLNLIFHPGFSTKDEITLLSGRGVGMSVVKESLHKVNGSIEINTADDYGTEFLLKLPITLALRTSVIVDIDNQVYAIPSSFVKDINTIKLQEIANKNFIEIRGEYFKIIFAKSCLSASCPVINLDSAQIDEKVEYLLIDTGDSKILLVVDSVIDLQNIIIKPLPEHAYNPGFLSGATILADGRVGLVFDLDEIYDACEICKANNVSLLTNQLVKSYKPLKTALTFYIGDLYCGVNYDLVQEAFASKCLTKLLGTNVESLVNLRGNMLISKNLHKLLEIANVSSDSEINLVLQIDTRRFAIQIDELDEIVKLNDDLKLADNIDESMKPFVHKVYMVNDKPLYMLKESLLMQAI